jgi:acyl carrier protein
MQPQLEKILLSVLEVNSIDPDDSVETVAAWDSVRHLQLVLAIEEQFGLSFEAETIPALTSVRAIASAIEAHGAAAGV